MWIRESTDSLQLRGSSGTKADLRYSFSTTYLLSS